MNRENNKFKQTAHLAEAAYQPAAPIPRAPLCWNMFGGTLGGPVVKNKLLFFFVDHQGQRFDHPPAGSFISVYTPAEMQGDFSALLNTTTPIQLYNPCQETTGHALCSSCHSPAFREQPDSCLMISPVAAALFASPLYPKTINNSLTNNALQEISNQYNSDQGDIRIDYRISDKDQLSGRFTRAWQNDPSTNSQALFGRWLQNSPSTTT